MIKTKSHRIHSYHLLETVMSHRIHLDNPPVYLFCIIIARDWDLTTPTLRKVNRGREFLKDRKIYEQCVPYESALFSFKTGHIFLNITLETTLYMYKIDLPGHHFNLLGIYHHNYRYNILISWCVNTPNCHLLVNLISENFLTSRHNFSNKSTL